MGKGTRGDATALKACRKTGQDAIMSGIGLGSGKAKQNMKDSDVREVLNKAAQDDVFVAIQACKSRNPDGGVGFKTCMGDAKQALADALGGDVGDVSDYDLKRDAR